MGERENTRIGERERGTRAGQERGEERGEDASVDDGRLILGRSAGASGAMRRTSCSSRRSSASASSTRGAAAPRGCLRATRLTLALSCRVARFLPDRKTVRDRGFSCHFGRRCGADSWLHRRNEGVRGGAVTTSPCLRFRERESTREPWRESSSCREGTEGEWIG